MLIIASSWFPISISLIQNPQIHNGNPAAHHLHQVLRPPTNSGKNDAVPNIRRIRLKNPSRFAYGHLGTFEVPSRPFATCTGRLDNYLGT